MFNFSSLSPLARLLFVIIVAIALAVVVVFIVVTHVVDAAQVDGGISLVDGQENALVRNGTHFNNYMSTLSTN